jgi:hypothetical protein
MFVFGWLKKKLMFQFTKSLSFFLLFLFAFRKKMFFFDDFKIEHIRMRS